MSFFEPVVLAALGSRPLRQPVSLPRRPNHAFQTGRG